MSNLIENNKFRKAYKIIDVNGKFQLCKVLNEYDNINEANAHLIKLLTSKLTENEVLKLYNDKKVF
jgi:hypothetical protein